MAGAMKRETLVPLIKGALDKLPAEAAPPAFAVNPATLPKYVGTYRDAGSGLTMTVTLENGTLMSQVPGQPAVRLVPSAENVFRVVEVNATLTFNERGGLVESVGLVQGPANLTLARIDTRSCGSCRRGADCSPSLHRLRPQRSLERPALATGPRFVAMAPRATATVSAPSPSGTLQAGRTSSGRRQSRESQTRVRSIWGDRVFAVTAISKAGDNTFKTGFTVSEAGGRPVRASVEDLQPRQGVRKDSVGAHGRHRRHRRRSGTRRAVRPARRR